ncbi:ribonucleases P/MRP protein subunit POP1-like [Antedon mediterranea]|uniref:ribonucleases P/MRP protein subunit POP1-like n=1 Tax=Antedon mediterranea TaxID=105859 RepID=UPI003AF9AD76
MMQALDGRRKGKRMFQRLPRHMRRRAVSHNVKRLPRSMRSQGEKEMKQSKPMQKRKEGADIEDSKPAKKRSRRHRRRPSNLRSEFNRRQRKFIWLETHLWHAKRFKMEDKWGHRIPLHSNEKGVRAAYRSVIKHCLMQDVSYGGVVELVGRKENILKVMNCITNKETGINISDERYLNGSHHGRTILYKKYSYPYRAIGPTDFMWNALIKDGTTPSDGSTRQLWLWLHPACFDETIAEIKGVCSEGSIDVSINDLRAELVRFHLEGPLARSVLIDALKVADVACSSETVEDRHWWEEQYLDPDKLAAYKEQSILWEGMSNVDIASKLESCCMMGLTARDPRHLLPRKRMQAMIDTTKISEESTTKNLLEKDKLSWSPIWDHNVRKQVKDTQVSQHKINQMRSEQLVPGTPLDLGRQESRIPVLILHNPGSQTLSKDKYGSPNFGTLGYGAGFDVIIPSGWGLEFWVAFYFRGARAGARREASSSHLQQGRPEFPLDYPDTQSGKLYAKSLREELVTSYMKKPPAKRLNYSKVGTENPFSHPWDELVVYWRTNAEWKDLSSAEKNEQLIDLNPESENTDIFILRSNQHLYQLQNQCIGKCFKPSTKYEKIVKEKQRKTESTQADLKENIASVFTNETFLKLKSSLVFVIMRMLNRGAPSMFSMICLPSKEDLEALESNPSSPGPIEPKHTGSPTPRVGKKRESVKHKKGQHDKKELDVKGHQSELDKEIALKLQTSTTDEISTNIDCCSRTIIGYVTNGAQAFSVGVGCSVGLCSFVGLVKLLQQKVPERHAVVLIRDSKSLQYRYAYIKITTVT